MRKHLLKDFTWVEFRDRLKEKPVILISLGSQEEQGPQAPMGDFMLTEVITARVAEKADAIAAPIIPYGYADYFRPIPGGVQLTPETFRAVLEEICANFLDHGLDHLVIMNGHGGNYPLIDQSIRKIKRERNIWIPCINLWRLMSAKDWEDFHPEVGPKAFGHGGDPMTSVYLHLYPELVRMDLIDMGEKKKVLGLPTSGLAAVKFNGMDVNLAVDIDDITDTGIAGGVPLKSSAEIGEKIVDHIVNFSVDFVKYFKGINSTTDREN
jgi:creatinine amidohydrolase